MRGVQGDPAPAARMVPQAVHAVHALPRGPGRDAPPVPRPTVDVHQGVDGRWAGGPDADPALTRLLRGSAGGGAASADTDALYRIALQHAAGGLFGGGGQDSGSARDDYFLWDDVELDGVPARGVWATSPSRLGGRPGSPRWTGGSLARRDTDAVSLKSSRVAVEAYLRLVHDTCAQGRDLMLGTGVGRTGEDALVALHRGRASLRDMAHKVDRILLSDVLPEEEWAVAREAVEAARLDLAVLWADAGPAP